MQGILLFAHGARDPEWAMPFREVASQLAALRADAHIDLAFLEFLPPNLIQAGQRLVQLGCTHIDVLPLFLGAGGHVRKDVPALMTVLRQDQPHVHWTLLPAIGEMPTLSAALAQIAAQMTHHVSPAPPTS